MTSFAESSDVESEDLIMMRSVPCHEYPPDGTREPVGAAFARALSRPSEPHGRNSAIQSESADSLTTNPLLVVVVEIETMESGSGTSPHDSNRATRDFQSSVFAKSCGSNILATMPIPAKATALNPGGASESGSISAIEAGLQGLSCSATAHPPEPRGGGRFH